MAHPRHPFFTLYGVGVCGLNPPAPPPWSGKGAGKAQQIFGLRVSKESHAVRTTGSERVDEDWNADYWSCEETTDGGKRSVGWLGIPGVSRLLWKLGQLFDTWFTRWENDWNTTFSPESFSFDSLGVKQGRLLQSYTKKNRYMPFWKFFSGYFLRLKGFLKVLNIFEDPLYLPDNWKIHDLKCEKLQFYFWNSILITIRMHFSHSCAANKWK